MKDFIPKQTDIKTRGLSPKAQKLMALREKAAQNNSSASLGGTSTNSVKAKAGVKKTSFNRKAV